MALVLMESCDLVNALGYPGDKWTAFGSAVLEGQSQESRTCWRLLGGSGFMIKSFDPNENSTIICGERVYGTGFAGHPTTVALFRFLEAASTQHVSISINSSGQILAFRGTTQIGISDPVVATDQWNYIEAKVFISDASGTVEVRVNGTTVLNLSGVDTRNAGTNGLVDTVSFGSTNSTIFVRDLYLLTGTGGLNGFLGPQVVQARLPNGAGDLTQWTPNTGSNFAAVDESDPDDDTTYVESSAAGDRDSYAVADFGVPDSVNGVQAYTMARSVDAPLNLATFLRRSSTNNDGTPATPAGSYGSRGTHIWETDPIAASAWTLANLNATQVGIVSS